MSKAIVGPGARRPNHPIGYPMLADRASCGVLIRSTLEA
jgi:hypothetical protein